MADQLSHAEVLGRYCGTFVDELVAAGVENVCLCPGSRSTPLALTFARHPDIKLWMHLDERSCAYFALGLSSISSPVAILCSSGTAAANFAPAAIEAFHSHRPLIVLTADRPQELRDLGANQTIDQTRLYGSAVRWFVEMPLPEAHDETLRYVRMAARRAVSEARGLTPGPVHLNFPFREPLVPAGHQPVRRAQRSVSAPVNRPPAAGGGVPSQLLHEGSFARKLLEAQRPLIVCGPQTQAPGIVKDLVRAGVPVLADPLSGARSGPFHGPSLIGTYDALLRDRSLAKALEPDLIVRFGAPPTSKPLSTYLHLHRDVEQIVFALPGTWPDPELTATRVIPSDGWSEWQPLLGRETDVDPAWSRLWQEAEAQTSAVLSRFFAGPGDVSEASAVRDLAEVIPEGYTVFGGNSMPVRDIDSFWPAGGKLQFFEGSRGASGIDGVVSTALGAAARCSGELVLIIGDLSFYHDMNGLLAARRFGLKATIVLINNDGGGIFSFLPQHDDPEHFETLFGTPHGLDFSHVAGLYGIGFQRVSTRDEYRAALRASFDSPGVQVIEIKTDREENLRLHQRIWDEVAKAVAPLAAEVDVS